MKVFMRGRVVPTISASVSWLIFVVIGCAAPALPKLASRRSVRASRFSLELVGEILLDAAVAGQQMGHEQLAEGGLVMENADHLGLAHPHDLAVDHRPGGRQP
jgi:hypothetical protein